MTYEVVDNYLPDDEFKQLSGFLMGSNFPVYYADNVAIGGVEEKNLSVITISLITLS